MDRSMDVFLRTSLDYPDIHFELNHHGKAVRHLPPVPGTIDRLLQVWNPRLAEDLLMVDYCTERIQIQGFIGRPSFHRKTAAEMYFYVNHRFVKDRLLMRATTEAYRASLPQRRYPFVILFVKVASEEVDVNVHPAKEEIRFRDEKSVWSALYHALRDTLSGLSQEQTPHPVAKFQDETFIIPAIRQGLVEPVPFSDGSVPGRMESESTDDFPIPDAPPFHSTVDGSDIPLIVGAQFIAPISGRASPAPTVNDFRGAATSTMPSFPPPTVTPCLDRATTEGNQTPVEMLGRLEDLNRAPLANPLASQSRQNRTEFSDEAKLLLTVKGQIFKTYILCETEDEVLIFDQHALHERILFEKFRKAWENHTPNPQELLFPQTIDIPRQFQGTFQGSQDLFTELGFELDLFGADSVVVRQIPSDMKLNEIQGFIEDVLHDLYQQGGHAQMTDRAERVLARMACRSAVKAGDPLSISEMQNLVDQYTFNPSLSTCPHGRRPVWRMSHRELERMFDRP
jgi:DNA mismatch repair protein MutL